MLTALALLLTALVMRPVADVVYSAGHRSPTPRAGSTEAEAWEAGTRPIKAFMIDADRADEPPGLPLASSTTTPSPPAPGRVDPVYGEDFPLRVVAPAFLLSELTTALVIGF